MMTVSERAKETLFEQKQAADLEGEAIALRVAAGPTGEWMLVADHPHDDDQVVEYRGSTVLLVDRATQSALDGVRLDCVLTPEGEAELILVGLDELDEDELDDESDDESEEDMAKAKTVQEMMTPDPIALPETASLVDAAQKMRAAGIGDVVVLDGETVCGIVTDRDIVVRGIADGRDPRSTSLAEVCSRDLTTIAPDDRIETAVRLMRERAIRRLPVVKRGRPVGILTMGDIAIEHDADSALADVSAAPPNV
jgi:CBS domain-containing protein/Fe-S cluster assembly iron-binding protein IscA